MARFSTRAESVRTGHADLHLATNNVQLSNIKPLQQRNAGVAGSIELTADGAADLRVENGETEPSFRISASILPHVVFACTIRTPAA